MPTISIKPGVSGGSVSTYKWFVFNKRCEKCQKHALIAFWWIHEQRTDYEDGTSTVERQYYCPQEPEGSKLG
jgi:hypothetical protein